MSYFCSQPPATGKAHRTEQCWCRSFFVGSQAREVEACTTSWRRPSSCPSSATAAQSRCASDAVQCFRRPQASAQGRMLQSTSPWRGLQRMTTCRTCAAVCTFPTCRVLRCWAAVRIGMCPKTPVRDNGNPVPKCHHLSAAGLSAMYVTCFLWYVGPRLWTLALILLCCLAALHCRRTSALIVRPSLQKAAFGSTCARPVATACSVDATLKRTGRYGSY